MSLSEEYSERAVETNQRHLITKILARYPNKLTFLRELLANADDAKARSARVRFHCASPASRITTHTVISNNGDAFSSQDWIRLTSIASGNPNENKIGFFGVGFYSVFALSERPTVVSGDRSLEFFWKGNTLFTKAARRNAGEDSSWTRLILPATDAQALNREEGEYDDSQNLLPDAKEIGTFLAELMCFASHLREIRVFVSMTPPTMRDDEDEKNAFNTVTVTRTDSAEIKIHMPKALCDGISNEGFSSFVTRAVSGGMSRQSTASSFSVSKNTASVSRTKLALIMNAAPWDAGLTTPGSAASVLTSTTMTDSLELLRGSCSFRAKLSEQNAQLYQNMTQKPHPNLVNVQTLTSISRSRANLTKKLLSERISPGKGKGRVFVGFVTSQTTGFSMHVSSAFVPTMEREHLDFASDIAKSWNMSLFVAVGILARAVHEHVAGNPKLYVPLAMDSTNEEDELRRIEQKRRRAEDVDAKKKMSFFDLIMNKAVHAFTVFTTESIHTSVMDEELLDDNSLFEFLEEDSGAVVVTSMANFCPIPHECHPSTHPVQEITRGFLSKEFLAGPQVWTAQSRSVPSDFARVFPGPTVDLPQFSSVEHLSVVPVSLSRRRVAGWRNVGALASGFVENLIRNKLLRELDSTDLCEELTKRPLRGLDETCAFVKWYAKRTIETYIKGRCGNCNAAIQFEPDIKSTTCPQCRYTLRAAAPANFSGTSPSTVDRVRLYKVARAIGVWDDEAATGEFALNQWKFISKDKTILDGVLSNGELRDTYRREEVCPPLVAKQCPELYLDEFTLQAWVLAFFESLPASLLNAAQVLNVWKVLLCVARFARNSAQREVAVQSLTEMACVPSISSHLAVPRVVHTTSLAGHATTAGSPAESEHIITLSAYPESFSGDEKQELRLFLVKELGVRETVSPIHVIASFQKNGISREELWRFMYERVVENDEVLEGDAFEKLKRTACVPRSIASDAGVFVPSKESFPVTSLFLPTRSLLDLNDDYVPCAVILPEKSMSNEKWAIFMKKLLKTNVVNDLLKLASSESKLKDTRVRALRVLVDEEKHDVSKLKLGLVPCEDDGPFAAPMDCFLQPVPFALPQSQQIRVSALPEEFAKKCGVQLRAPVQRVIFALGAIELQGSPIESKDDVGWQILEYISTRLNDMDDEDLARLSQLPLIPVPVACGVLYNRNVFRISPRQCFFADDDLYSTDGLKTLFVHIPKGIWSKTALLQRLFHNLGVRTAPGPNEMAILLSGNPTESLKSLGAERYLALLRALASDFSRVSVENRMKMKASTCLLGKRSAVSGPLGQEQSQEEIWDLHRGAEIVIEDDSRYRRLFAQTPSCPSEIALERMYIELNSKRISLVVTETSAGDARHAKWSKEAMLMDARICDRLSVLLQKVSGAEFNKARVDAWSVIAKRRRQLYAASKNGDVPFEDALVLEVPLIQSTVRLGIPPFTNKLVTCNACIHDGKRLFITKTIDFFHIASALVATFSLNRSNDRALLWATLLQSSTLSLEEMGFVLPKVDVPPPPLKRLIANDDNDAPVFPEPNAMHPQAAMAPKPTQPMKPAVSPLLEKSSAELTNEDDDEKGKFDPKRPINAPPTAVPKLSSPPSCIPPIMPPVSAIPRRFGKFGPLPPSSDLIKSLFPQQQPMPPPVHMPPPVQTPPLVKGSVMSGTDIGGRTPAPDGNVRKSRSDAIDNALRKCRPSEASDNRIFSPGSQVPLGDSLTDCTQPHDLIRDNGIGVIECFTQRGSQTPQPFKMHALALREFSNLLVQMSVEIFQCGPDVIHLFWDERGVAKAFNRGGSLFFNAFCWIRDSDSVKNVDTWKRWYGTFCHELAHNNWAAHDSNFANFLELFCVEFSASLMILLQLRGLM